MKNILTLLLVLLSTYVYSQKPPAFSANLLRVVDGDTAIVTACSDTITIRFAHIDCPEKKQQFGSAATEYLKLLIYNAPLTIHPITKDRYGRLVAVITTPTLNVNKTLVLKGLAYHYTKYSDDLTYTYAQEYAEKCELGVWSKDIDPPVLPWVWRKRKREGR